MLFRSLRDRHPRLVEEAEPLGSGRLVLAVLLGAILILSFVPTPLLLD